jgi:hypothetical protein
VQQAVLSALVDHWVHADGVMRPERYVVRQQQMLGFLQQLPQQEVLLLSSQAMQQLLGSGLGLLPDQLVPPVASRAWVDGMLLAAAREGQVALVMHCLSMAGAKGWLSQLPSAVDVCKELDLLLLHGSQDPNNQVDVWAAMMLLGWVPGGAVTGAILSEMSFAAAAAAADKETGDKHDKQAASKALWQQLQQRLQDIQQLAGPTAAAKAIVALIEAAARPDLAVALFKQLQQVQQKAGTETVVLSLQACDRLMKLWTTAAGSGAISSSEAGTILQALQLAEEAEDDTAAATAAAAAAGDGSPMFVASAALSTIMKLSPAAQAASMQAYAVLGHDAAMLQLVEDSKGKLLAPAVAAWHARVRTRRLTCMLTCIHSASWPHRVPCRCVRVAGEHTASTCSTASP